MATQHFPHPRLPTNANFTDFKYFKRQLDMYFEIMKIDQSIKLPVLLSCLGHEDLSIYDGLPDPKSSFDESIKRLEEYFSASTSLIIHRKEFYEARQNKNESASQFAVRLRKMATECKFTNSAEMLRDIFIICVSDNQLGERFLMEDLDKLTFEVAVNKAEIIEKAHSNRNSVNSSVLSVHGNDQMSTENCEIQAVNHQRKLNDQNHIYCYRCGMEGEKANHVNCPARDKMCSLCKRIGHFQRMCRSNINKDNKNYSNQNKKVNSVSIFSVGSASKVDVIIDGHEMNCIADTGAAVNIMPLTIFSPRYLKKI